MADNLTYQMSKGAPIVWAYVITAKDRTKVGGDPRFEVTFLFPAGHPDLKGVEDTILQCRNAVSFVTPGIPLKRGDKVADEAAAKGRDREWARGHVMLSAHGNTIIKAGPKKGQALSPPRLVVLQNGAYVRYSDEERPLARKFFYAGVQAVGTFGFAAYEGMGGGISCYLNEILSLNVGAKIQTGVDDEAKYGEPSKYLGHVSTVDPTAEIQY